MPLFIIGGLVFGAAMALVLGAVFMALWNWLMPEIFGLTTLTYWQAWGIVLMAHILFKTGNHSKRFHDEHHHDDSWKEKFRSKFRDRMFKVDDNKPDITGDPHNEPPDESKDD